MKKFYRKRIIGVLRVIAFIILLPFSPIILSAENEDYKKDEELSFQLDEVIVTATKTGRKETEIISNVAVITEEEIEKYQPSDVTDLLRHVPGLTLEGFGSHKAVFGASFRGVKPTIRGILVMLDGYEMNVPSNPISVLNIPLNNIKRIEVIKTPASVLYGPTGVGGVINIITKKPTTALEGNGSILYGSFDRIEPAIYSGGLLDNGIMYGINYRYIDTNGFRDNGFTRSHLITSRLEYIGDNVNFEILVNVNEFDAGTPGGLPINEYKDRPERTFQKDTRFDQLFLSIGTKLEWSIDENSLVRLKTSYRDADGTSFEDFGFIGDWDHLNTGTAEANYQLNINLFGIKNTFLAGFEYRNLHEGVKLTPDDFWIQSVSSLTKLNIDEDTWGFYLQDEISPIKNLLINLGVRYDIISTDYKDRVLLSNSFDKTQNKLSPRVGFTYSISPSFNVFGNYTEGIRSIVSSRQALELRENLDIEKVENYELGIRGSLFGFVNYSIAGFYIISKDKVIDTSPFEIQRADRAKSKGTEMSINMNLPYGFYTNLDYTYQHAKFERFKTKTNSFDGNRVPLVPENIIGTSIGWHKERYGNIDLSIRYVDDKYIDSANDFKIDDYTVVDLKYTKKI
ncbi:MAG: TonB-dependent receptor [Candidatus Scalindua rubra]|uniref:TonB-dependent receptor n=1 Tax=Candidatus Scalindua rubra TaxID=1872076 RepID=A0A1E3XCI7_9BACT|nr:MAG: TonB-dependent receptor [Candidatus Scalindua rubra]